MDRLVEGLAGLSWVLRLGDRLGEIAWVLDHLADLDADFLAIYRIDLHDSDLTGPRFFALAHRVTAYQGVMAARVEEERQDGETEAPIARESAVPTARSDGAETVSLTAFRFKFPGVVSMAEGG